MKERPILFSGPMVRAILEGRKTQTRRVVKLPERSSLRGTWEPTTIGGEDGNNIIHDDQVAIWHTGTGDVICCPYGKPGDRLWVRETWTPLTKGFAYRADGIYNWSPSCRWHPSIHMPRAASRILLEITAVRVERLQDISEEDAKAEGIEPSPCVSSLFKDYLNGENRACVAICSFASLWESINGHESWDANSWVWVIEFKRVTP